MKITKVSTWLFVFALALPICSEPATAQNSLDAADGDPANAVYVDNNGSVGIGTTNPHYTFTVQWEPPTNNINPVALFRSVGDTRSAGAIRMENTGGNHFNLGITNDNAFGIAYNANISQQIDLFRITPTGNIGIGTTTPNEKLAVEGQIRASVSSEIEDLLSVTSGGNTIFGEYEAYRPGISPDEPLTVTLARSNGYLAGVSVNRSATWASVYGVYGEVTTGQSGKGVWGKAATPDGIGVYGQATGLGEVANHGGYFIAQGSEGTGAYGYGATGLYGEGIILGSLGPIGGTGVKGYGYSTGVEGIAWASYGVGVHGTGERYDFYADGPGVNYGASSSIRWKTDVSAIDDPLTKVNRLRGVYFRWDAKHGGQRDVGMIAEEVGEVLPEIVAYERDSQYASGLDYSKLTPLLVEAVKALNARTIEMEGEIAHLKSLREENADLYKRINTLEARLGQQDSGRNILSKW
jgi:Chaperone of endosialidase